MQNNKKQKVFNINLENHTKELFESENKDTIINLNNKRNFSEIRTENDYGTPIINNKIKNQYNECFYETKFSVVSEISNSFENSNRIKTSQEESPSKIKYNKINRKCPGCYPIFQPNQLGHVGPDGCLGNYD